jgi:hypothetical protein
MIPDSYADGTVATGRASHARRVKGDDPYKTRDILVFLVEGWAWGLKRHPIKLLIKEILEIHP